jgi:hypothetical protein
MTGHKKKIYEFIENSPLKLSTKFKTQGAFGI